MRKLVVLLLTLSVCAGFAVGASAQTAHLVSVSGIPSGSITTAQSFRVTVEATNDGGLSTYGTISVTVTGSPIVQNVTMTGSGNRAEPFGPGQQIYRSDGTPFTIRHDDPFQLLEGTDTTWSRDEHNSLSFDVTPQSAGTFDIYVRSTLRIGDAGSNTSNDAVPDSEDAAGVDGVDRQGWPARRYAVSVSTNVRPTVVVTQPSSDVTVNQGDCAPCKQCVPCGMRGAHPYEPLSNRVARSSA
jgi:hypothetical protein